jgi:hypothetical protein
MKMQYAALAAISGLLVLPGCTTEPKYTTSNYHPGPVAGEAVGYGAGVVVGNVAATGVGAVEGVAAGVAAPFDTTTHVVRHWRTEVTPDGRTIQVPEDILVDEQGRVVCAKPIQAK